MDHPPLPSPPSATASTVFIDSNLNTHMAMAVSPDDSVADFKRKIRIEHELCFPDVGDISVRALKVKRRGAFYHLSDTMLVRSAFEGSKGTYFLHVDVVVSSISKNQGGTVERFLSDRREQFSGNCQFPLKASENLDNDRPHEKQSVFADGVDLLEPKSFSCLIENHKDTLNDPLDDGFYNPNESTHLHHPKRPRDEKENQLRESDSWMKEAVEMPHVPNSNLFVNQVKDVREKKLPGLEAFDNRAPTTAVKGGESIKKNDIEPNSCLMNANAGFNFVENKMGEKEKTTSVEKPFEVNAAVLNDGGLNYVNEISKLEKDPGEAQLGTDVVNLPHPEQSSTILADGHCCLIGHFTDDKKKRKKRKRLAKCQQTQGDLSIPQNSNITISPHSGKVKNIEHEHALEESRPISLMPEVMDGCDEATMLNNYENLAEKVDDGVEKVSGNLADGDSVIVNFSEKNGASDFDSMSMRKDSHSKSISNIDSKAYDADFNTDNVNISCPQELSEKLPDGGSSLIDHLIDSKKKKKSRRRSSKSQKNEFDYAKTLSNQIAILPQSNEVHNIDLEAPIEEKDAICSVPKSQACNNEDNGNSHRDITKKNCDATDRASEKVANGDSLGVVTSSEKIGVSDFSSVRMAKDLDSYLVSNIDGMATETAKVKAALDDIHNEFNTKAVVSSILTEPALLGNPAANASRSTNKFHKKKRSNNSSEKVLSSKYSVHSSEFTSEENPEEQDGIDFEDMDKESDLVINKDTLSQSDNAKLGSINPTGNTGSLHSKRREKSEKAGFNDLQVNICEPIHSLMNQANKDNHKAKLNDQDRQDLISLAEVHVLADCAVPISELHAKSDYTKSHRKKKRSSKIELQDQQATQQGLSEGLVKEPAEDTAKNLFNNRNEEPNKVSYSFANHNESAFLGGSEVDLVMPASTNEKAAVRHKKKSAKSRSSGKRLSNCDTAHSEGQIAPGNFENATAGDEYPSGVSIVGVLANETFLNASHENLGEEHPKQMTDKGTEELADASNCGGLPSDNSDKVNFHDVFCPSTVQHEPIVSSNELLSPESESNKQRKSKRKRKSSKHGATHDLGYPSESVKQRIAKSEHPNDEVCSRSFNKDSVKRTIDDSMNHATTFSNFMSAQNSNDSKIKVKIQGTTPDSSHQLSPNHQERSKHVNHSSEKIFSKNTSAHEVLNQSKATAITSTEPPIDPAASSASSEDDTPIQAKRYRVAARKFPSRSSGRKLNNDNQNASVLTSNTIFHAATSDDSEDEFDFKTIKSTEGAASDTSSASSDSDEDLVDKMQKIGSRSVANGGKDNVIDGEDITLSQLSANRSLGAILRSSNSYKRAKLLASQSQAEDSDSQPVDVVLETQPEPDI